MNRRSFLKVVVISIFVLGLTSGASSAETQVVSEKGSIKVTELGKGYRFDKNGWIYIHIEGGPYERGFQHGYLVAPELNEILRRLKYLTYWETGKKWNFFVDAGEKLFASKIDKEFLEEMKGIAG